MLFSSIFAAIPALGIRAAEPANHIANPGFEDGLSGWTPAAEHAIVEEAGAAHDGKGFDGEPSMARAAYGSIYLAWISFRDGWDSRLVRLPREQLRCLPPPHGAAGLVDARDPPAPPAVDRSASGARRARRRALAHLRERPDGRDPRRRSVDRGELSAHARYRAPGLRVCDRPRLQPESLPLDLHGGDGPGE